MCKKLLVAFIVFNLLFVQLLAMQKYKNASCAINKVLQKKNVRFFNKRFLNNLSSVTSYLSVKKNKKKPQVFSIYHKNIKYWSIAAGITTFLSTNSIALYCFEVPYNLVLGSFSLAFTFLSATLTPVFLSYKTVNSGIELGEDLLRDSVDRCKTLCNASENIHALIYHSKITPCSSIKIIQGMRKELHNLYQDTNRAKTLCSITAYNPGHINAHHVEQCCSFKRDFKTLDCFLCETRKRIEKCERLLKNK